LFVQIDGMAKLGQPSCRRHTRDPSADHSDRRSFHATRVGEGAQGQGVTLCA
jgi:hypothetical protein